MWTKKSYDALYKWVEGKTGKEIAKKALLEDGLDDIVARLEASKNLGEWYKITHEAADAVGPGIVEVSANEAEAELNEVSKAAAALGSIKSDKKAASSRENGKKGGRPAETEIETPKYRIDGIHKARLNGRNVKLFKAYEYNKDQNAYVFCGQFSAPAKTANKNLVDFID